MPVTDAEQFTRVAEGMSPDRLAELMNAYYEVLCAAVERHSGLVADLSGDSMVAIWTGVRQSAALSRSACAAALAIVESVETFNRGAGADRLPTRIGLDAGRLLLGDIGSEQRREYRAVGDIVTTAARLQSLNRQLGTRVLVSAAAAEGVEAVPMRRLGRFLLLGKTVPVEIYELLPPARARIVSAELRGSFEHALELFARREFERARRAFARIAAAVPGDEPARLYAETCERYAAEPPPPAWRGTVRIGSK